MASAPVSTIMRLLVRQKASTPPACAYNQSLDIKIGRAKLRLHKLGESEEDDPRHAFPDHPGPATRLGTEQLELQLVSPDGEPRHYFGWVIGTYGNHEDGCRAIRLHAVG